MLAQDMRQRVWRLGIFVTGLVLLLGIGCSGGDGSKEDSAAGQDSTGGEEQASTADLDAALKKSFRESDAPGVVAAVQTPDYTWVRALGVADRASKEPMTPDVHHRIGSVTKTFTATLLLQAADEGLLSLDDTIDQYVKGVPNGDKITLRQMANMTSGIASYTEDKQWGEEVLADPIRGLEARRAGAGWHQGFPSVRSRYRVVLLQHELRAARSGPRAGDGQAHR